MKLYEHYRSAFPALVAQLENARHHRRLSHAFLVQADTDRSRREFAMVLAQIAACPESRGGRPCLECRVCRELEAGSYPELYTLSPVGKMYQIKVGDRNDPDPNTLRYFEEQFHLTSTGAAGRKIGVIHDCDRMNPESQNAFLKTLEEPPPETLLILTTGSPSALLPTTRSRCQLLPPLENRSEFCFGGSEKVFGALHCLLIEARGDLARAEEAAAALIAVSAGLNAEAEGQVKEAWQERLDAARRTEERSFVKRMEELAGDEAFGACRRERLQFLSAIHTFCAQVFLLSDGAAAADLANPEVFAGRPLPSRIDPGLGLLAVREAEALLYTLRFNVNDELALRTFAVNLAMKPAAGF